MTPDAAAHAHHPPSHIVANTERRTTRGNIDALRLVHIRQSR
ncbi:hypothetical protein HMPREF3196_01712 [Bifidobacterium bifidum]|uniref:Uncharacterized protein n=1 Tax=Bifidobacterium bifidum TaxID=1681 RepID=A0A133KLA5_BIFBI|nr:hypothetical protein HMPREF3196_01712 [Bifidobacterium bifidum]